MKTAERPACESPLALDREEYDQLSQFALGESAIFGAIVDELFPKDKKGDIATLLLRSPSTAVMHYTGPPAEGSRKVWGVMMAVNYHNAHSDVRHQIVVQNPNSPEDGQGVSVDTTRVQQ
jgi:hypothetical protein